MCRSPPGCGHPGSVPACSRSNRRWTNLPTKSGIDPVELRIRNEPDVDPELGIAFSSRNLVGCLRRGAELFGWSERDPRPARRREGRWLIGAGSGVIGVSRIRLAGHRNGHRDESTAPSPSRSMPPISEPAPGRRCWCWPPKHSRSIRTLVEIRIGDSDLPRAGVAGGSSGTTSWGWAVHKVCRELAGALADLGGIAALTDESDRSPPAPPRTSRRGRNLSRYAFGAQFVQVRVNIDTGEVRVPRMVGVFAAGRIVNPTHRSIAVDRRYDHGTVDGPARGGRDGPGVRRLRQQRPRRLSHRVVRGRRRRSTSNGSTNTTPGSIRWAPRGSARSASSERRLRWPMPCYNATGVRVRSLPITMEDLLARLSQAEPMSTPSIGRYPPADGSGRCAVPSTAPVGHESGCPLPGARRVHRRSRVPASLRRQIACDDRHPPRSCRGPARGCRCGKAGPGAAGRADRRHRRPTVTAAAFAGACRRLSRTTTAAAEPRHCPSGQV